jgi:hypothetical protein
MRRDDVRWKGNLLRIGLGLLAMACQNAQGREPVEAAADPDDAAAPVHSLASQPMQEVAAERVHAVFSDASAAVVGRSSDMTDGGTMVSAVSAGPLEPPYLGAARSFAVLGGSNVTNTGVTTLVGELGVGRVLAIDGIASEIATHAGDALVGDALRDVAAASAYVDSEQCSVRWTAADLTGLTLTPGVHCFASAVQWTGTLVLDARGSDNAVFILRIPGTLTTLDGASVAMLNCAHEGRVFWQVGGSAVLGPDTAFAGNLVALENIVLGKGTRSWGRIVARTGNVTMDTNQVSIQRCEDAVWPSKSADNDAGGDDAGS